MDLDKKNCLPCTTSTQKLSKEKIDQLMEELDQQWQLVEGKKLFRSFTFKNFKYPLKLVQLIGEISEEIGHHPDIFLSWGVVKVEIYTHKVGQLTENDFILAKKIDAIYLSHFLQ